MALASFSPSLHTSTEVPDWKHFCTSWHTAGESPGAHSSFGFLQPLMVTIVAIKITLAKIVFRMGISLERLRNIVITIGRQQHVLGEVHLDSMPFPNRDRRWNLNEAVEDGTRTLGYSSGCSIGKRLRSAGGDGAAARCDLAGSRDDSKRDRCPEDLKVVVVDFVLEPLLSNLVESVELVEIDGVTVRHNQPMEHDGHAPLLTETRCANLPALAQYNRSIGDDDVLVVVGIQRIGHKDFDRA